MCCKGNRRVIGVLGPLASAALFSFDLGANCRDQTYVLVAVPVGGATVAPVRVKHTHDNADTGADTDQIVCGNVEYEFLGDHSGTAHAPARYIKGKCLQDNTLLSLSVVGFNK